MPNGAKLIIHRTDCETESARSENIVFVVPLAIDFSAIPNTTAQNKMPRYLPSIIDASGLAIMFNNKLPNTSAMPDGGAASPVASAVRTRSTGNAKLANTARNAARNVVKR